MSDEPAQENLTRYSITFSLDKGDFFRRACPSCGRHFKTKADVADLAFALQPAFRQLGVEIGAARSEHGGTVRDEPTAYLHCPYCGHKAEASDMLTPSFSDFLKRYMMREVLLPKVNKMLGDVADSFGSQGTHSRGLISLEVRFEHEDSILPPRPIAGPEPPDMKSVELLCCGKGAKILDGWSDLIVCPFCGTIAMLQ